MHQLFAHQHTDLRLDRFVCWPLLRIEKNVFLKEGQIILRNDISS